jgi:flagellar biosynthesis/type III secretory pathway chaperone
MITTTTTTVAPASETVQEMATLAYQLQKLVAAHVAGLSEDAQYDWQQLLRQTSNLVDGIEHTDQVTRMRAAGLKVRL